MQLFPPAENVWPHKDPAGRVSKDESSAVHSIDQAPGDGGDFATAGRCVRKARPSSRERAAPLRCMSCRKRAEKVC